MSTSTFGIRILQRNGARLELEVFLVYLDWSYLPRTRPFFVMALARPDGKASELSEELGQLDLDEGFLSTQARRFIASMRELKKRNFPLKKKHGLDMFHHLRGGRWEHEADLPQRRYELVATDPRWFAHLEVGQTFATTAYEFDEAPDRERAEGGADASAPYSVELLAAAPMAAGELRRAALTRGVGHPQITDYIEANPDEHHVRLDLRVRSVDANRSVADDEAFLTRIVAAGTSDEEHGLSRWQEEAPTLFTDGRVAQRLLVLELAYQAGEPAVDALSLAKWDSRGCRLRQGCPYSIGGTLDVMCLVPARLFTCLEPRTWGAHAWSEFSTRVRLGYVARKARPVPPIELVTHVARLGNGRLEIGGASVEVPFTGLVYDVAFPAEGALVGTDRGVYHIARGSRDVTELALGKKARGRGFVLEEGVTWIASEDRGLLELRGEEVVAHKKAEGLAGNTVVAVVAAHTGELVVSTTGGVSLGRPSSWTTLPTASVPKLARPHVAGTGLWFVAEKSVSFRSPDGRFLKFKSSQGIDTVVDGAVHGDTLFLVTVKHGQQRVVSLEPDQSKAELVDRVPASAAERACSVHVFGGDLWLGTRTGGFVRLPTNEDPSWFARERAVDEPSIVGDEIRGLWVDPAENQLWVGGVRYLDVVSTEKLARDERGGPGRC